MMARALPLIVALLLSIGAVALVSVRSLRNDRDRLLDDFTSVQLSEARQLAAELQDRFQDLEEDARLLVGFVRTTRADSALGADAQARALAASFDALAGVVRAYRSIVMLEDGRPVVTAMDPEELPDGAEELTRLSAEAAKAVTFGAPRTLVGPTSTRTGRPLYFHVVQMPSARATLVIAIDLRRLLPTLLRAKPGAAYVVVDPGRRHWIGCTRSATCHLAKGSADRAVEAFVSSMPKLPSGTAWPDERSAEVLGLPAGAFAVAWVETARPSFGPWTVLIATSAASLHERTSAVGRRVVAAMLSLLLILGGIGSVLVWQQRRAAALQERIVHIERVQSLEDQLIRAEKLATTGVLAAGIAHEVGTPLGIIRGRAEVLLTQAQEPALRHALEGIVNQIDRISSTIRTVLDFSRAQPVSPQPVRPEEAVATTLTLLEHRFRKQNIQVDTSVDPDLPPAAADPDQLQQVLVSLLMNACDACPEGGVVTVSVVRDPERPALRWTVTDSGLGIAPEHLRAVFDPFFTTKKRGEGTGLGLSVAASIVRNHGGEISISSELGRGASVTIVWPIAKDGIHV